MPTLKIEFLDMFMYVYPDDHAPHLVLLPNGRHHRPHTASVTTANAERPLNGIEVSFCYREGDTYIPIPGAETSQAPTESRLLDLRTVLGNDVKVSSEMIWAPKLPDALSARIRLPHGTATAPEARKPLARGARWSLPQGEGLPESHGHELTDHLIVEVPVENRPIYACFTGGDIQPMEIPMKDQTFQVTFTNHDNDCDGKDEPPPGSYTLDEYAILYALTDAGRHNARIPAGYYGDDTGEMALGAKPTKGSNCRPICGGVGCPGGPTP